MPRRKNPPIADKDEVLQTFTSIMRGEMLEESARRSGAEERTASPPKISERCRAAELLGKQLGLFEKKEDIQPKGEVAQAIRQVLEQLRNGHADGSA